MTQTKERKRFKDLNLLDRFLFAEAMEDQQNMELLLDIILNQETHLKHPTQTEKELRRTNKDRQVRLDVYAVDEEEVIYDAEPQKINTKNFPKRSRLYQGLIDSNLLPPGSVDFNALNTVVIILITPFDIFGQIPFCRSNGRSAEHGVVVGYYSESGNTSKTSNTDRKRTQADEQRPTG